MASSSASPESTPSAAPQPLISIDDLVARLDGPLSVRDLWKTAQRVGMSAEQFERLSEISPHRLRRGRGGSELVPEDKLPPFLRCARIYRRVLALCNGDEAAARTWVNSPAPVLKNKKPVEAAETVPGAKNVDALVSQLQKAAGITA